MRWQTCRYLAGLQTPTTLSSGEKIKILNAEDLASNASTMSFTLHPQPVTCSIITVYNPTAQDLTLEWSPDNVNFLPMLDESTTPVLAQKSFATVFNLSGAGYHKLTNLSGSGITAGTVWVAR